jgi:4-amino-4-deoxy-L-arabinose transferase-like glycosyltransferase
MIFLRRLHDPPFIFRLSLIIAFIVLVLSAWNAPMSGDEHVHVEQARKNIRYFQTNGEDTTALYTPISRLKHYGQSFDTITTYVADTLDIDDLYRFRHLSNAVVAWLIILFVSLLTLHTTGSRGAAVLAVLLMLITGRFMGHAMNNLKDIPFALSFVWSIYFIFRMLDELPKISWKNVAGIITGIALGISIRIGGLLIFAYLLLFLFLWIYYLAISGQLRIRSAWIVKVLTLIIIIFVLSFGLGILLWPWALEHPISNSLESLQLMHDYPTTVRQIFEGKLYWSDQFPWYYLVKYLLVTLPIIVLAGFLAFFAFKPRSPEFLVKSIFLLIALGFPIFYAMVTEANVYGGWRQMLFIFPLLAVISSLGLWHILRQIMPYPRWKYSGMGIIA